MIVCLCVVFVFFFFKQKTAYEMRISDWSSDVCSSDLLGHVGDVVQAVARVGYGMRGIFNGLVQPQFAHAFTQHARKRRNTMNQIDGGFAAYRLSRGVVCCGVHASPLPELFENFIDRKSTRLNSSH